MSLSTLRLAAISAAGLGIISQVHASVRVSVDADGSILQEDGSILQDIPDIEDPAPSSFSSGSAPSSSFLEMGEKVVSQLRNPTDVSVDHVRVKSIPMIDGKTGLAVDTNVHGWQSGGLHVSMPLKGHPLGGIVLLLYYYRRISKIYTIGIGIGVLMIVLKTPILSRCVCSLYQYFYFQYLSVSLPIIL